MSVKTEMVFCRAFFILGVFLIHMHVAWAQDAHFSQMYAAPMQLNPALVGSSPEGKFSFNYRAQWAKLPGEWATYQASYEYSTPKKPTNFGVMVVMDKMGAVGAKSTEIQTVYAHNIKLSKQLQDVHVPSKKEQESIKGKQTHMSTTRAQQTQSRNQTSM